MKNIVNPLPEIFNEPIPVLNGAVWTNENDYEYGRRGVGYDYEVKRNRFIILTNKLFLLNFDMQLFKS